MSSHKERMLSGEAYCADDPELLEERRACRLLAERFNTTSVAEASAREEILRTLLGGVGDETEVMSPFQCDYGYQITIGARTFINFGAVILDSARVTIGDDVQIGPSVHLITPTHPLDPAARRTRFESALPIVVGDGAWLAAGVIVLPGVTIGADAVVGAGSLVTKDVPERHLCFGSPARAVREL
jgi:maltose O-acetyltransferase